MPSFPGETEKNHKMPFGIVDSLAVIPTWYFQKTNWKHYRLSQVAQRGLLEMLALTHLTKKSPGMKSKGYAGNVKVSCGMYT
jgi:hypothetical protein